MLVIFNNVQFFFLATLWTVALQAPLSMRFSRQEYWSGLPFPPPGDLLTPGIEPVSLKPPALAVGFFTTSATLEALIMSTFFFFLIKSDRKRPPPLTKVEQC